MISNKVGYCNGRYLDLVLSSLSTGTVTVCAAAAPLVPVDAHHPPLKIAVTLTSHRPTDACPRDANVLTSPAQPTGWNFYKADFPSLYSSIAAVDWSILYDLDLEESLTCFYDILT
ncbi:unnamed protein product [Leptidea sinapis]|uniref:Endonuclease/exonuclease/phosphatase domain-containing protein n=1 Tax=Leptidea sinapis TaxID=189913 RepID=A0A5E4R2F2_9NEOP|nr:unnamed protein product [Leptidea sinapis]